MSYHKKHSVLPRLFLFIGLVLAIQFITVFFTINNPTQYKSKAQTDTCPDPQGTENYSGGTLFLGPHLAANNNPDNYLQVRKEFNCQNKTSPDITNKYLPVTIIYDQNFLKGSVDGIKENLLAMKKYGLFPIIRVATYMNGDIWVKNSPADAKIMGENLCDAIVKADFSTPPMVVFLNEPNLDSEWGGKADAVEFTKSLIAFEKGLRSKDTGNTGHCNLYFPALSYGVDGTNGVPPAEFIKSSENYFDQNTSEVFANIFINYALNIYGTSYDDILRQFNNQSSNLPQNAARFKVITELGPTVRGSAVYDCQANKANWENAAVNIFPDFVNSQIAVATTACFGDKTYPAIGKYDGTASSLIELPKYGQITNPTTTPTTTQTPTPSTTPTATNTPTPTGTASAGITINLKLKFQGIVKKPKNPTMNIKVKIAGGSLTTPLEKTISITSDNNSIWSGTLGVNINPGNNYSIFIKGPKHLAKKICVNNPTETDLGTYNCSTGAISLQNGNNTLDFSKIILLAGDIGTQDGLINQDDLSSMRTLIGKKDTASVQKADVNFDGIVDTQDWSLIMATLKIANGDDE
jgi:hypothetical protein